MNDPTGNKRSPSSDPLTMFLSHKVQFNIFSLLNSESTEEETILLFVVVKF